MPSVFYLLAISILLSVLAKIKRIFAVLCKFYASNKTGPFISLEKFGSKIAICTKEKERSKPLYKIPLKWRIKSTIEKEHITNEICIYEAKLTKLDEIEELMREVAEFYLEQDGVIDVHYIKRTHRQKDFNAVKEGELPVRLTRNVGKVTYVLYWVLENEEAHARISKLGVEKFYKRWNRCLTTMPKIILGENVV